MRSSIPTGQRLLPARPVFVDRSGQRRRRVVMAGAALATALVAGLVILIVGFVGPSSGHIPGFPGADGAGSPVPTRSVAPARAVAETTAPQATVTSKVTLKPSATSISPTPRRRNSPSHPPRPTKTH